MLLFRLGSDLLANYITLNFYLHGKIHDPEMHTTTSGMTKFDFVSTGANKNRISTEQVTFVIGTENDEEEEECQIKMTNNHTGDNDDEEGNRTRLLGAAASSSSTHHHVTNT